MIRLGRYFCELHGMEEDPPAEEEILYRAEDREALAYRERMTKAGVESRIFAESLDTNRVCGVGPLEAARIIVPSKDRIQALRSMKSRSIDGAHVLFQCERCGALNRADITGCTNCGRL